MWAKKGNWGDNPSRNHMMNETLGVLWLSHSSYCICWVDTVQSVLYTLSYLFLMVILWGGYFLSIYLSGFRRLPKWLSGKEFTCQCRRCRKCGFDPCVGKIPWKRTWQPTPVCVPGKSHRQRSLEGYSPWGCKEPDTTEATKCVCERARTHTHTHTHTHTTGVSCSTRDLWSFVAARGILACELLVLECGI